MPRLCRSSSHWLVGFGPFAMSFLSRHIKVGTDSSTPVVWIPEPPPPFFFFYSSSSSSLLAFHDASRITCSPLHQTLLADFFCFCFHDLLLPSFSYTLIPSTPAVPHRGSTPNTVWETGPTSRPTRPVPVPTEPTAGGGVLGKNSVASTLYSRTGTSRGSTTPSWDCVGSRTRRYLSKASYLQSSYGHI